MGHTCKLSFKNIDEVIKEIIFQIISTEKYSFSDKKTICLVNMVEKVATTDVTVFIHGPTGTGKEVISNLIHKKSDRADKPFIAINCAAIPENMLEAMLFGHEKGAFTGASSANKGIFRAADTGTLLLDEISEMPLSLQAKLLRVLQEKKVTPIGGQRDIDVNVRVIATTNRDMLNEVKEKKFREDLYYRLNVFPIETHNLSERPDDILPISIALLNRHTEESFLPYISDEAQKILREYSWPGNVRELENVLQRAIVLCENNIIDEKDIMIDVSKQSNFYNNIQENLSEKKLYKLKNLGEKMKPSLTNLKPTVTMPSNQTEIKNIQEEVANLSPKIIEPQDGGFLENIKSAIQEVNDTQKQSAELTKNFELGLENDLTKVMIQQQLSSLGFQMTLNVRNKVLSAYKDIMNMPV